MMVELGGESMAIIRLALGEFARAHDDLTPEHRIMVRELGMVFEIFHWGGRCRIMPIDP